MLRTQSGPLSQLECYQECWLEAIGTVVLLAGVLDLAAGLVTMAPFRITRSFSPFKRLFLSSETKFLCFSLSNLVLSGDINTFLYASLLHSWCECDNTVTLSSSCSKHNNKGLILFGCFFPKRSSFVIVNELLYTDEHNKAEN